MSKISDRTGQIPELRRLADWCRSWAASAGSSRERQGRMQLAEYVDERLRILETTGK